MPIDLSNISLEDLVSIQNEVLRNIAVKTKVNLGNVAATHDSHSSNHSNYSKVADLQQQIEQLRSQITKGGGG